MADLISGPAWPAWFLDFERSAWKLETQFDYTADEPDEMRRWLAGELNELSWMQGWIDTIRRFTAAGKRFERVRVQSEPLTDYLRFQREITPLNIEAGEDIRLMSAEAARALRLPTYDFWVIDDERVAIVHRDATGTLGGEVVTDTGSVVQHKEWRQLAWQNAIPFDQYVHDTS